MKREGIAYELKRYKRQRSVHLRVKGDGTILVTAGMRVPKYFIEAFVKKNAAWLEQEAARALARAATPFGTENRAAYLEHKEAARLLAHERAAHFASFYSVLFKRIAIRNQKTMWGSCSGKGNLNFNYKIVHLPPHLSDYIIVHELCHLKEMNHSPRFWALVARACPDYRACRTALHALHRMR